jgi:hypothetical protein
MAAGFDLTRTARSLLNIEVNTIVRDNMCADQMPAVPHSLLDIAQGYADTLSGFGVDMPNYFATGAADPAQTAPGWVAAPTAGSVGSILTVSTETFNRLRWAAQWTLSSNDIAAARIPAGKRVLLDRIVNNCDTLKEMFKRFDPSLQQFIGKTRTDLVATTIHPNSYTISPDDLILLQKMWDIGVEEIVAQTVVHVTGDVTTRVQEAMRSPGSEPLFSIHRQSIDVSVARWKDLLDAVKEIAGAAVGVLLGVGKP